MLKSSQRGISARGNGRSMQPEMLHQAIALDCGEKGSPGGSVDDLGVADLLSPTGESRGKRYHFCGSLSFLDESSWIASCIDDFVVVERRSAVVAAMTKMVS
jgi:hypothetical protein